MVGTSQDIRAERPQVPVAERGPRADVHPRIEDRRVWWLEQEGTVGDLSWTQDRAKKLVQALIHGAGEMSKSELMRCCRWCEEQIIGAALVVSIEEEVVAMRWPDGAPEPTFVDRTNNE